MADYGENTFEEVLSWMIPGFPLTVNQYSIDAITVACISLIANAVKRNGEVRWDEPLEDKLERWNLIEGLETYDDLRLNLILVGEPGSGKTGIMKGIDNLNPYTTVLRKSQPHPDQLIGSTEKWYDTKNREWNYEVYPGELASDIFIMDEVLSVYVYESNENRKIREMLRSAMSRVGTNKITKPMVKIPTSKQVNYYPECTLIQGFPLRSVPINLLTEGDLRRSQIVNVDFPLGAKEDTDRFSTDRPRQKNGKRDYAKALKYLQYLRNKNFSVWIKPKTMDYIKSSMRNLKEYTAHYGIKAMWYYKIGYFDIESQLVRYAVVMSVIRNSTRDVVEIEIQDVQEAWKYFSVNYADSLIWLNKYTTGEFKTTGLKTTEVDKTIKLLKWMEEMEEKGVKIRVKELKKQMIDKKWFGTPSGTRRFYRKLTENGIIRSGRHGREWYAWVDAAGKELLQGKEFELPW